MILRIMNKIEITLSALKEFVSDVEENEFLRDHDERFSGLRKQVKQKSSKLNPPLNAISKRLYDIADNTFYCIELFNYKFYLLAKAIIHAIETENPLSLANNTRSLLEQLAVFVFLVNHVSKMLDQLKGQGSLEKINKIIAKTEAILKRVYSGEGKKSAGSKEGEAIHVNTAMDELTKEIGDAQTAYDYLCEFVHPNFGSNFLISSGELGRGKIEAKDVGSEVISNIVNCGYSMFLFLNTKKILHPAVTWNVSHLVELCFLKGAKITNVFSEKEPLPIGDGRAKETAFYFKKARTSQEAIKLQYQYLESIGYNINLADRVNGGVKDGYVFDEWNTHLGIIWFKTPIYSGVL